MRGKFWFIAAGVFGATAVAMGAFHSHGLDRTLERMALESAEVEKRMGYVETAVRYQMVHAVALFLVGVFLRTFPISLCAKIAGFAFFFGTILFSGALYGLAFTGQEAMAHVAPFGGGTLILGWLAVALFGLFVPDPEFFESPWAGS